MDQIHWCTLAALQHSVQSSCESSFTCRLNWIYSCFVMMEQHKAVKKYQWIWPSMMKIHRPAFILHYNSGRVKSPHHMVWTWNLQAGIPHVQECLSVFWWKSVTIWSRDNGLKSILQACTLVSMNCHVNIPLTLCAHGVQTEWKFPLSRSAFNSVLEWWIHK